MFFAIQLKLLFFSIFLNTACLPSEAQKEFTRFRAVQKTQAHLLQTKSCPGCDLLQAQLAGTKLTEAQLQGAYLKGADLNAADLRGADLREAVLIRADMSTGALLHGANLVKADLSGANLNNTSLAGVRLCLTKMPDGKIRNDHCHILGIEVANR